MESLLIVLTLLALVGLSLTTSVIFLWRYRAERAEKRKALSRNLLRTPGESLRAQLEDAQRDLPAYVALGLLPLPLAVLLYLALVGAPEELSAGAVFMLALGAQLWLVWKLSKTMARRRALRLAYEDEVAIGQELNGLGRSGYRVFHDFAVDERGFNIDHIVVGPAGVFAVAGNGQATAAADWLRRWLSNAIGERVWVQPLLVTPGSMRRVSDTGTAVVPLGQIREYFAALRRPAPLSDALIRRIVHQLAVRPGAYAEARKAA